jgi:hypothetical protein
MGGDNPVIYQPENPNVANGSGCDQTPPNPPGISFDLNLFANGAFNAASTLGPDFSYLFNGPRGNSSLTINEFNNNGAAGNGSISDKINFNPTIKVTNTNTNEVTTTVQDTQKTTVNAPPEHGCGPRHEKTIPPPIVPPPHKVGCPPPVVPPPHRGGCPPEHPIAPPPHQPACDKSQPPASFRETVQKAASANQAAEASRAGVHGQHGRTEHSAHEDVHPSAHRGHK